ncbi:MAG: GDSL-type esterase/lipase family protein, partial [Bacteroidota bacterium]
LGAQYEVIGAGVSGNKVTDLQKRLKHDIVSKHPSIVIIYIGINDVWHYQFASRGLSGTPKDQFKKILTDIVEEIQSGGAQVILCTPSVVGEKVDGTNRWDAMLDEYADISRGVAREQQISLLDLRKEFLSYLSTHNPINAEKDILTYDGVHLNERGNRFVAEKMLRMLEGLGLFFPQK